MNDPIIHAPISNIVEAIKNSLNTMSPPYTQSQTLKLVTEALASLESSEREVSNQIIIDATNTIRSVLNNWQDAFESDFIKAQDALDFIQRSIPSERELLEGFKAHIKKYRGTEYELNIDRYLAEKQSKTK